MVDVVAEFRETNKLFQEDQVYSNVQQRNSYDETSISTMDILNVLIFY